MNVKCLIKMLQECDLAADVMLFCDNEVSHIGFIEQSLTDDSIYLYEHEPDFIKQGEDRNLEITVHSVTCFNNAVQLVQTSHTKIESQNRREIIDDYAGEAILDRYVDPEEFKNVDC